MRSVELSVIRRVGGLEVLVGGTPCQDFVIRRVGGLEEIADVGIDGGGVIRRVGGLEGLHW